MPNPSTVTADDIAAEGELTAFTAEPVDAPGRLRPLTQLELDAVQALGDAVNAYHELPEVHAADQDEFVAAIHQAQNIILARPGTERLQQLNIEAAVRRGLGWVEPTADPVLPPDTQAIVDDAAEAHENDAREDSPRESL